MVARRKKAADPLAEPIVRPNPMAVALIACGKSPAEQDAIYKEARDFVAKQKMAKLILLANRHNVDMASPHWLLDLCLHLADRHEPGSKCSMLRLGSVEALAKAISSCKSR